MPADPHSDTVAVPREPTDDWAEAYCALLNRHPDGAECKVVEGVWIETSFRDLAKGEIRAMLSAAPSPVGGEGDLGALRPSGSVPTEQAGGPVVADRGREAIWKVVHEVWRLLDDGETDSAGITTIDQTRLKAVSDAMDALEALVPESAGPFWGGFPVNYLWPKGSGQ